MYTRMLEQLSVDIWKEKWLITQAQTTQTKKSSAKIWQCFSHKDPSCIRVTHGTPQRHSVKGMDDKLYYENSPHKRINNHF
jgi:hypothetical protein